uniref:CSON011022 protein n=1 Tax=Culicoides sonorensis TaxID=179676 RepID=A0A336M3C8_CULSO
MKGEGITLSRQQISKQQTDVTKKRKRKRNISIYRHDDTKSYSDYTSFYYYFSNKSWLHHSYKQIQLNCKKKSKQFSSSALVFLSIFFLLLYFPSGFASTTPKTTTTSTILVNGEPGQNFGSTVVVATEATTTTIVNKSNSSSSKNSKNDKNKNVGSTIKIIAEEEQRRRREWKQQLQSDQPQLLPLMQQQPCSISELTCSNGKCVPLNKYCDNVNDCGDSSDEPRFCTKCNRTYHGTIGLTYNLELHRPKEDKIPYVCLLTFTASGGIHGDLIQITIDSFTIGKFTSYTQDGCPDGYLQISEQSRISVGGMWCGNGWGPSIIYSETRTLVLAVKLFKLSRDSEGYNFDFRIKYKVLPKDKAVVRYGGIKYEEIIPWSDSKEIGSQSSDAMNVTAYLEHFYGNYNQKLDKQFYHDRSISTGYASNSHVSGRKTELTTGRSNRYTNYTEPKYYLGDLIPGTYCSRIFSDCDKKACRLQSPNFPGVYPRNLTCYYAVRQHEVPPGKHALIIMRQPKGNLIWINSETQATIKSKSDKDKFVPKIHTWDECDNVQDYVTVYDGYTTRDPIIMKFCGGGQALPASISSGPELLIDVRFVEQKSPTYAKNKRNCEFWIRGTGHGILESPQHSLPPNSTCLYHLQGTETASRSYEQMQLLRRGNSPLPSRFKVWISVYKFEYGPKYGLTDENALLTQHEDCTGILRIWDGPMRELPHSPVKRNPTPNTVKIRHI